VRRRVRFDERVCATHEVAIVGHVNVRHAFGDACPQHRERHALKRTRRYDDHVRPSFPMDFLRNTGFTRLTCPHRERLYLNTLLVYTVEV